MDRRGTRSACALLLVLAVLLPVLAGCSPLEVPDVVGRTQAEATGALEDAGYQVGDVRTAYSSEVPSGCVISTNPEPGEAAVKGAAVDVTVNSGLSGTIVVPSVAGLEQSAAEDKLAEAGLLPVTMVAYSPRVPYGQAISQIPKPGSRVAPGAEVFIQLSRGVAAEPVAVPVVTGAIRATAEDMVRAARLLPQVYLVYSDSVARGEVITQAPKAGDMLNVGDDVAIAVSLGKGTGDVTIPTVMGKAEADALTAIEAAGLTHKVIRQASSAVPQGTVMSQMPAGGSTTDADGQVAVVVSLGAGTGSAAVAVPDVAGLTDVEAISALQSVGFVIQSVEVISSSPVGTVAEQLPAAGSSASSGSLVVIAVSAEP